MACDVLSDAPMTTSPKLDITAKPEDAFGQQREPTQTDDSPGVGIGSRAARRGSNAVWWGLLAAFGVIVAAAIVGAAIRNEDRGVRGPADQAAPDAPRSEKVPVSAER